METAALTPEAQALVERVRSLLPVLAKEAAEAEQQRRLTDLQVGALEDSGVFRLMVPRCYGGLELDVDAFLEVGLLLATADVSSAWVTTFLIEHNWMLCQFPERFQKELYADADWILAPGAIAPTGQARAVDGGFRISGRWSWATGVMHSSWVILGTLTDAAEGPGGMMFLALPREDVRVEDVWHVDGMCATGSNDIVVEDVFVPSERSVGILEMAEARAHGASLHGAPLYRTPMIPILEMAASMPIIGRAGAVVRDFAERLQTKSRMNAPGQRAAERPAAQMRLARATVEAREAELLLRDVVGELMVLRDTATRADRHRWAAMITHAVHRSRQVIQDVAEASGGSAHFLDQPLQRALRDVQVASSHVVFDRDAQEEGFGRALLGLEAAGGLV